MKTITTLLMLFGTTICMGQDTSIVRRTLDTVFINTREVPDTSFPFFLDSLKQFMLQQLPHIKQKQPKPIPKRQS